MVRIKSDNVQMKGSIVLANEQTSYQARKIAEAMEREKQIVTEAQTKAQEIIDDATSQAQIIVENAKAQALTEVEGITQTAHEEGFEAGYKAGFEKVTQDSLESINSIEEFCNNQFEIKRNIIKSAHLEILQLSIEIARKVCNKSLEIDPEVLKEITLAGISALPEKQNITIIVNPKMAENIYSISDELKERVGQLQSIKVVEDNSVSPDGTIIEAVLSRVDNRMVSQINEITDKLMGQLNADEELNG